MTSFRYRLARVVVTLAATTFASIAPAQAPAPAPEADAPATTTAVPETGTASRSACTECGVVKSITAIENKARPRGRSARARANAGNSVEAKHTVKQYWSVVVTMDDGSTRNFTYKTKPEFREGDRVTMDNPGHHVARVAD